jgi:hypothetical protein
MSIERGDPFAADQSVLLIKVAAGYSQGQNKIFHQLPFEDADSQN